MTAAMKKLQAAADAVRRACGPADVAVVLGRGLGGYEDVLLDPREIAFDDIPGFPKSTVSGHAGKFVVGDVSQYDKLNPILNRLFWQENL